MSSAFNDIMVKAPGSNVFDLSEFHKTTGKFGTLIPVYLKEVMPGDVWKVSHAHIVRTMPLATPVQTQLEFFVHYFFVPMRLCWKNFQNFIRGVKSGNDTTNYSMPFLGASHSQLHDVKESSLANYLGLPVGFDSTQSGFGDFRINAMPFYAYQRVWYDYYRHPDLDSLFPDNPDEPEPLMDGSVPTITVTNGFNAAELTKLRRRNWERDYFTSALPFAQKGNPVAIPIIGTGPVEWQDNGENIGLFRNHDGEVITDENFGFGSRYPDESASSIFKLDATHSHIRSATYDPNGTLKAIINNVVTTVKDLRVAEAMQRFLEINARAGNRYFEYLKAIFGVNSPDSRLQRAEYIGGSRSTFLISEILQTSETTTESPQGNMSGHGINSAASDVSTYRADEWGYIIAVASCRPRTLYEQGIHRLFRRFDRFDYPLPNFAHIGEQEVKNYEIYYNDGLTPAQLEGTFGYLPRYMEMKTGFSRSSGYFTSDYEAWIMSRKFANPPSLNASFIECNPTNEIFALQLSEMSDYLLIDISFNMKVERKLPRFDVPSLV